MPKLYKAVSEAVATMRDKAFAAQHVVKINKGSSSSPRWLEVIEWHTAIRMLDAAFGPFGYDLDIVNSTSDYTNGLYTVDMRLTARAIDDETGEVVSLTRPGRGLGLVPRSALQSDAEHDRQAHGAKSDAITNATKALGDGFGLYLYQKDKGGQTTAAASPAAATDTASAPAAPTVNGQTAGGIRPSVKQMKVLVDKGYPAEFVNTLEFGTWKGLIDDLFGGVAPRVARPSGPTTDHQLAAAGARPAAGAPEPDDIPF